MVGPLERKCKRAVVRCIRERESLKAWYLVERIDCCLFVLQSKLWDANNEHLHQSVCMVQLAPELISTSRKATKQSWFNLDFFTRQQKPSVFVQWTSRGRVDGRTQLRSLMWSSVTWELVTMLHEVSFKSQSYQVTAQCLFSFDIRTVIWIVCKGDPTQQRIARNSLAGRPQLKCTCVLWTWSSWQCWWTRATHDRRTVFSRANVRPWRELTILRMDRVKLTLFALVGN